MLDLNEVISKVERIELSADARQRHLAQLHALQVSPAAARTVGTDIRAPFGGRRTRGGLATALAAAAVAVVAGTSALLVPALHAPPTAPAAPPAASTAALSTKDSPINPPTEAAKATGNDAPATPAAAFSKQLAAVLGITDAQATTVTARLNSLGRHGGVDPTSPQFAQIAAAVGVKPSQLAAAIDQIQKAQLAISGSSGAGPSGAISKSTALNSAENLLASQGGIDSLAAALGLSQQKATELAGKLAALQHGGGLDPRSGSFQTVAQEFGLTADRLVRAIDQIKRTAGN